MVSHTHAHTPYEGMCFRIQRDLPEHPGVTKRPVQFPVQHGSKIDLLLRVVVEPDPEHERFDDLEPGDAVDRVVHAVGPIATVRS